MNHDIFISYSSKQKSIADGVCQYLEENGCKCWMAPRDIPVGGEYGELIESAIKSCKLVVLVFSKQASLSKWVKGEVNVAFTEDKPILPFRVDDTEIKGSFRVMLNQMHWIDAFPNYSDKLPDLLDSVRGLRGESGETGKKAASGSGSSSHRKLGKTLWVVLGVVLAMVVAAVLLWNRFSSTPAQPTEAPQEAATSQTPLAAKESGNDMVVSYGNFSYVMKRVEGGTFQMGSESNDAYLDEGPVHTVAVAPFYMGETEVTQAMWVAVMGSVPTYNSGWKEEHGMGDAYPAYRVSWNECQEFIRRLNEATGLSFRLPTEEEWEFAARGGNLSNGNKYAGSNTLDNVAWYDDNSDNKTRPVKGKQANELGLYDMSGNVWEWCQDLYGPYAPAANTHPTGYRVLRGGSWHMSARYCRITNRDSRDPSSGGVNYGFRLAL